MSGAIPPAAAMAVCALASPASAHGFGQRYDLPLPLYLYLYGTAAVVVVTFVLVALFVRRTGGTTRRPRLDLLGYAPGKIIAHPGIILLLKLVAAGLFVVTVAAGFIGDQNPYRNIAPTMVWIIVWVGVAYVSAFVGDLWALINPWATIFDAAAWLYRRVCSRREFPYRLPYPAALGVWPAVILLLVFSWIELVYPAPAVPAHIACFAAGYSILTWTGMALFGRETWMRHGEVFSVVFGAFARFAPTEARAGPRPELILRPFGAGLLDSRSASPSMTAFVLLLLSTVLFDGLLNTPEWTILENAISARLRGPGEFELIVLRTAALVAFWLLFLGAYTLVGAMMSAAAAGISSPREIAQHFAFTLIPIAIGYHLAHYVVFLLVQGQYIIPLMSDPFGWGWNLFGTAGYRVDIAVDRRPLRLVHGGRGGSRRARDLGLSGAQGRDAGIRTAPRQPAIPGSAHGADGGLHLHQSFDSLPSRSSSGGSRRVRRRSQPPTSVFRLTRSCPNPEPAACKPSARTNSQNPD